MTDIVTLVEEGTVDESDLAEDIAHSETLIRAKDIKCGCVDEPRIVLCQSCEAYDEGLYVGLLGAIVAARLGVEITTRREESK